MRDMVQGGLLEAPLHRRVYRRALFLDDGLDPLIQLFQAAVLGHGKQGQNRVHLGGVQGVQRAGPGGLEGQDS